MYNAGRAKPGEVRNPAGNNGRPPVEDRAKRAAETATKKSSNQREALTVQRAMDRVATGKERKPERTGGRVPDVYQRVFDLVDKAIADAVSGKSSAPDYKPSRETVTALAAIGCKIGEIASLTGCSDVVLRRMHGPALELGINSMRAALRKAQFAGAMAGNATLLVFLGKQEYLLKQRESLDLTGEIQVEHKVDPTQLASALERALLTRQAEQSLLEAGEVPASPGPVMVSGFTDVVIEPVGGVVSTDSELDDF